MNVESTIKRTIAGRYRKERRFQQMGMISMVIGMMFLLWLLVTIVQDATSALRQTLVAVDISLDEDNFDQPINKASIKSASFGKMIKKSLRKDFPDVKKRKDKKQLYKIVSNGAEYAIRDSIIESPELIGTTHRFWVFADDEIDMLMKGLIDRNIEEGNRRVSDKTISWVDELVAEGRVETRFNWTFFTSGDSRDPELSGIWGAMKGSIFTILITMLLALPIGVAAAVYLQEFAPKNRFTDLIEVNINNLAAVPSIIFGLLGLAILINYFGLPRSVPMVGGMVLALMTLPTVIISSRTALAAVPPSIREAALGVGASRVQMILHHVLPLAAPGILTGSIISLARALGETAPLLVIGMVAFIVDIPTGPDSPSTVLPVQIYLWADSPERAFVERTSAAILVLLIVLVSINGLTAMLRNKVERRW
ncbi:MAG: phosphate ABC transporter permease PstA [Gammaproteobacteria bacterium]|nr:phosphate ABC transporter permease PstA [Gammaproteobacteria bacterium]